MFTRNYYNVLHACLMRTKIPNGITYTDGTKFDCYGAPANVSVLQLPYNAAQISSSFVTTGYVVLGSGSTPATLDDYNLEKPISSVSHKGMTSSEDENGNLIKTLNFYNNGSEPITIREVGIAMSGYKTNASNGTVVCMGYRAVLDTPYVVPAGANGYITLKFDMPTIPTA